ncbi:PAS domain S-box protein [Candidatus Bipolaricaulota bacterium]|nr:PAS domain S-box protein [Candidatus Bipolaricaulota bacterium]
MNLVAILDLIFSLSIFYALMFLLTGWKRALRRDVKLVLTGLLTVYLLQGVSRFLEWTNLQLGGLDPFSDLMGTIEPILWVFFLYVFLQQISDQRKEHLNAILHSIRNVNQLLVKEDEKKSLIQKTCNELFETRGFHHVWIALLDEGNELVAAAGSGLEEKLESLKKTIKSSSRPEKIEKVLKDTDTLITKRTSEFCEDCPLAEECKEGTTITTRIEYNSRVYGLLSGCMPETYVNEKEIRLLEEVTDDIAFGLHDIEVQEAHLESERKYRSLFNSVRDAMLVADTDRNIIDCNPAFTKLFGYDLNEIKGKKTEYLYHDKDEYEEMGEKIEDSIGDPNFFYTIHYEKKNGEVFSGETNVFYLKEDGGEIVGFIGLIRDVTDKIERQKKLKRSEKRYRTLFETTGTAMMIFEEDTSISLANEEVENLTGYSKEEIEGTSWTKLVANEDQLERMKEYHSLRREDPNSAPNQYEFKLVDKAGNVKDVLMTIDVISDTKKSVASVIDITGRKRAENRLRESEKKFRRYVENAPVGVVVVNEEGEYVEVNEAACEMTGYSKEELLDMEALDLYSPEVAGEAEEALERLLDRGELEVELPYLKKDGTSGHMMIEAVKISENRYLGFSLDVTERKEAEEKLKQATLGTLQALNRTIEAKDEYTGEHIDRVQKLSVMVGKEVGLSEERLEQLRYASILHDIGKIGVSDSILGKPGELTEDEWKEMERHPEIGERIVSQVDKLKRAAQIIGQHQEQYDGSGYPEGLEGEEITLEARIVSVADAWDAMRTDRPYREALPKEEAITELKENAGSQFDPEIVDILLDMIDEAKVKFWDD